VGAALAGLLGQWGVRTLAIDRDTEVYRLPRAAHFDHEIMRLFQQLGIANEIADHIRALSVYEFRNAKGETLLRFDNGGRPTVSGWQPSYMFHQPAMELALRKRLRRDSHVEVQTGCRFVDLLENDERGVSAVVAGPDDHAERVSARFMVGADGGASLVRRAAGLELFDYGFEEPWLVIDTIAHDESDLPQYGLQICDPTRPTTVMPMSPGRRRWEFMLLPGEQPQEMLDDSRIARLLSAQTRPGQVEVIRKAVYEFHGLVAKDWRSASVLIAGDAAHQMPPFMGQGMCSGLRDAANLAWKIALIIKAGIDPALLDTYQIEREPHVRHIIERAIHMGRVVCTLDQEVARQRDAEMIASRDAKQAETLPGLPALKAGFIAATPLAGELFPQPMARLANGSEGRLDDLLGNEFWLISGNRLDCKPISHVKALRLGYDLFDDGTIEEWLGQANAESVIVRPDRYVFATGNAAVLANILRSTLAPARTSGTA